MATHEDDKVKQVKAATDEVVGIMHQNINKVVERGERLDDLQDKTDQLQEQSQVFNKSARKIKNQMWWKNVKLNIAIAAVCIAILIVIVLAICLTGSHCGR